MKRALNRDQTTWSGTEVSLRMLITVVATGAEVWGAPSTATSCSSLSISYVGGPPWAPVKKGWEAQFMVPRRSCGLERGCAGVLCFPSSFDFSTVSFSWLLGELPTGWEEEAGRSGECQVTPGWVGGWKAEGPVGASCPRATRGRRVSFGLPGSRPR
uniref:Interferon-induced transmembrane protein 3 n=1 Tax=Sus scrofa TaxID=9823 RepID=A0A480H731_PIG